MESDTPMTDAEEVVYCEDEMCVPSSFSRQLERELAAAIKHRDVYLALLDKALSVTAEAKEIAARYEQERDEARGNLRDACAEIARIEARFYDALTPQQIAERNGWDCFAQQEGGGA